MESSRYKSRWSQAEELTLIQAVIDREVSLFGSMSGIGTVKTTVCKRKAWEEVANVLNSQFFSQKRESKECRKKYANFKSKAKQKLDASKKTGGGPAETLSQAEELLLQHIGGRASTSGLESAVDTDGDVLGDTSNVKALESSPVPLEEPTPAIKNYNSVQNNTSKYTGQGSSSGTRKRKAQVLAEETLELDKERITMEKEKINMQMELIKEQNNQIKLMNKKTELEMESLNQQNDINSLKKEVLNLKLKGFLDFDFS